MTKNIDPRTVIIIAGILGSIAFLANKPLCAHVIFGFATLLALSCGSWRIALASAGFYLLAQLLSEAAWVLGGSASVAFVMLAYMTQKLLVLVLIGTFMSRTTTLEGIGAALARMKTPHVITLPLMVMFRFLPTIRSDTHALLDSLKTRGIIRTPLHFLVHPFQWIEIVAVPLLMRATRISDELAAAGLTRGLGMVKNPVSIYPLGFTVTDLALATAMMALIVATIWLQI